MSGPSCARKASQGQREQQNMYFQKCLANKNSDGGLAESCTTFPRRPPQTPRK
jgi:hypothetical protein